MPNIYLDVLQFTVVHLDTRNRTDSSLLLLLDRKDENCLIVWSPIILQNRCLPVFLCPLPAFLLDCFLYTSNTFSRLHALLMLNVTAVFNGSSAKLSKVCHPFWSLCQECAISSIECFHFILSS